MVEEYAARQVEARMRRGGQPHAWVLQDSSLGGEPRDEAGHPIRCMAPVPELTELAREVFSAADGAFALLARGGAGDGEVAAVARRYRVLRDLLLRRCAWVDAERERRGRHLPEHG